MHGNLGKSTPADAVDGTCEAIAVIDLWLERQRHYEREALSLRAMLVADNVRRLARTKGASA
jgi:hypothetical protein